MMVQDCLKLFKNLKTGLTKINGGKTYRCHIDGPCRVRSCAKIFTPEDPGDGPGVRCYAIYLSLHLNPAPLGKMYDPPDHQIPSEHCATHPLLTGQTARGLISRVLISPDVGQVQAHINSIPGGKEFLHSTIK